MALWFLIDLTVVLGVGALTTVLFGWLRLPVVLGYLIAGAIIGPHVPIPLVADPELVHALSELGVILLLFSIGLEFSVRKIARIGPAAALTAGMEVALLVSLGFLAARVLGWSTTASLFAGACTGISSTMIVARIFDEHRLRDAFTDLVFAVLVFEDILAIVLLAVLTAVAHGAGLAPSEIAELVGRLFGFLAATLIGGLIVVPRLIRLVARQERAEMLLITVLAVCFGLSALAAEAGYSVALGAFLAGMLVSEAGQARRVEPLIDPFRDVFAAVFFVSVGMTIEPRLIAEHWLPIIVFSVVVLAGKAVGVTMAAFLTGNGLPRSVRSGLSLAQIGEFSFILAGLGATTGAASEGLLAIMVTVSAVTTLLSPVLVRLSGRAATSLDAHLPKRLHVFVTLYGSWIEGIRATRRPAAARAPLRRALALLAFDTTLLAATVIGGASQLDRLATVLADYTGLAPTWTRPLVIVTVCVLAAVFLAGVVRLANRLATLLAAEVVPEPHGGVDLGNAPRRALVITLELGIVLVIGLPLVVLVQPFVGFGALVLVVVVVGLGVAAWRSISNLQGHVRASGTIILEALTRPAGPSEEPGLDDVRGLMPGIPGLTPIKLLAGSPAVGRSLAELDLRAQSGATVLAIVRGEHGTILPTAGEVLRGGDVLALAGGEESITAARALLQGVPSPRERA